MLALLPLSGTEMSFLVVLAHGLIVFLGSTRDENFSLGSTGFFLKLTFHTNKTFQKWAKPGYSVYLPYANNTKLGMV